MPEGVRIPGRAGIAAMRMTWPPSEAEPVAQLAVEPLKDPCQFQHAGITSDVVGRAVEPRTVMRADKREQRLFTLDLCNWQADAAPALEDIGHNGGLDLAAGQVGDDAIAV